MRVRGLFGLLLATILSIGISSTASALFVDVTGIYTEDLGFTGDTPDFYEITNAALSESTIITLVFDLSTSADGAFFDPAGSPFVDLSTDATGFDGFFDLVGNQLLTLTFTDFDPGETFLFGVETDDAGGGWTLGADFAGARLDTSFQGVSQVVQGFYLAGPGFQSASVSANLTTVPEPGTFGPLGVGLVALTAIRRNGRRRGV